MICVGNALVGDDAVGCAIFERLVGSPLPRCVGLELLGVGGIGLLDRLSGEEALVMVDAVQFGATAGTVHVLARADLPPAVRPVTSHGIGLREAIELGEILFPERVPATAFLVGVEGRQFDRVGEGMTPAVAAAVEPAVRHVLDLAYRLSR